MSGLTIPYIGLGVRSIVVVVVGVVVGLPEALAVVGAEALPADAPCVGSSGGRGIPYSGAGTRSVGSCVTVAVCVAVAVVVVAALWVAVDEAFAESPVAAGSAPQPTAASVTATTTPSPRPARTQNGQVWSRT